MTKEEALTEWVMPAIRKTWNEKKCDEILKALAQEPCTDAVNKTGTWKKDIDNSRRWDRVRFYCSECGNWQTYGETDYCPSCGAKMKGGD